MTGMAKPGKKTGAVSRTVLHSGNSVPDLAHKFYIANQLLSKPPPGRVSSAQRQLEKEYTIVRVNHVANITAQKRYSEDK